jgi:hypothetical protein
MRQRAWLGVVAVVLLASASGAADMKQRLAGRWDEAKEFTALCGEGHNLLTQKLSPDGKQLVVTFQSPKKLWDGHQVTSFSYEVRETAPDALTLFHPGETRKSAKGDPVVWQMVFVDRDTYRWRVTDDPPGVFVAWGRRCP